MHVIGVGYPRTGTMSLKFALEQIGMGRCYHMIEVFNRPQDIQFWLEALNCKGVDVAWDTVFSEFQSSADCPGCFFWRELLTAYPNAKFVLTTRDADAWYESFRSTVYEVITHPERSPDSTHERVQKMAKALILDEMLQGRATDRNFAIEQFHRHNSEIIAAIPAHQLLVFDVADGWEPLCEFLGVSEPSIEFPRANTRQDFQSRFLIPDQ